MNILEKIIKVKQEEVSRRQSDTSVQMLKYLIKDLPATVSFRQALLESSTGIIAEFKRKSPSKGWIFPSAEPEDIIPAYTSAGASALSVLTDETFFGGSLKDLQTARQLTNIPLLRKDFVIDSYQLYQARALGADVILLIASALTVQQTESLACTAKELGLEVLLEIHSEKELAHINKYVDIVGVNNRNLSTFQTDIQTSFDLGEKIPSEFVRISESGITTPDTIVELRKAGFRGFLVGETFMKTGNPGEALSEFIKALSVTG